MIDDFPHVSLCKCENCGHHFTVPSVNESLRSKYYNELNSEYFLNNTFNHLNDKHDYIFNLISKYKKGGEILEIGCGNGFLLEKFRLKGWNAYGIEPSNNAVEFIQQNFSKINIKNQFLDYNSYKSKSFDLILLFDVIEHLSNPVETILLANYYLKNGGLLVIGTGNIKSVNAIISKNNWGYFGSWEHISFYSPKSMKYLLSRNKFNILKIKKTSYNSSYITNIFLLIRNLFIIIKNNVKYILNNVINKQHNYEKTKLTFDHMIIISEKYDS
jgi:2-polyprenyl-3-methyl-5-hydroxy-6-metoxy-1,4-benzoquinol methylase